MLAQSRSKRTPSGGRYTAYRKKRSFELAGFPILTKLGKAVARTDSTLAGIIKRRALYADTANVFDRKAKKHSKSKIKTIADNPANRNFIRRNIITKGTVNETEAGKAVVTARPGQDGVVNAVLLEK